MTVNPERHKMHFAAYPVVTGYPLEVPKLKVASIKWAYEQPTTREWCQVPDSIKFRFDMSCASHMRDLMSDLDAMLVWMINVAKAVFPKKLKRRSPGQSG